MSSKDALTLGANVTLKKIKYGPSRYTFIIGKLNGWPFVAWCGNHVMKRNPNETKFNRNERSSKENMPI